MKVVETMSECRSNFGLRKVHQKPFFVHFFGADGAGKTTQGEMLARHMKREGIDNKLVRIRSGRTFASILYRLFKKLGSNLVELGGDGRVIRITIIRNNVHQQIWCLIELLSMIPWLVRGVFIPLRIGKVVIAERYMIDAIATIAYLVNDPLWSKSFLARLLLRFIPRNSVLICLDASYAVIAERKGSFVDPKQYIEFQRKTYLAFAKTMGAYTIDTSTTSPVETHNLICQHINV